MENPNPSFPKPIITPPPPPKKNPHIEVTVVFEERFIKQVKRDQEE